MPTNVNKRQDSGAAIARTHDSRHESLINILETKIGSAVSAKELHAFIGPKSKFADWIKNRIKQCQLIEGVDYGIYSKILEKIGRGRPESEYILSVDAAKQLCMVEGNEKGREARLYFIECEKKLRQVVSQTSEMSDDEFMAIALQRANRVLENKSRLLAQAEKIIEVQAPKVEYYEKVLNSESVHQITVIAKELGMTAVALNERLKKEGVQYRSGQTWVLYAKYQNMGLTETKTFQYTGSEGELKTRITSYWTETGRLFIHRLINKGLNQAFNSIAVPAAFDIDLPFTSEEFKNLWVTYHGIRKARRKPFGWNSQRKAIEVLREMGEANAIIELHRAITEMRGTPKTIEEVDFGEGHQMSDDGKITNVAIL